MRKKERWQFRNALVFSIPEYHQPCNTGQIVVFHFGKTVEHLAQTQGIGARNTHPLKLA